MKKYVVIGAMLMGSIASAQPSAVKTVESVNLDRYVGKWHEVAKFPNRFQKNCAGNVTAEYHKLEDGRISVTNRCMKLDGINQQAAGVAKVVEGSGNAKLKVRFAPAWLSWLPMVWGDYWIIALAQDYSYVVVGEPKREYLWVLSRTPTLSEEKYLEAVKQAEKQGFDVKKLERTKQEI